MYDEGMRQLRNHAGKLKLYLLTVTLYILYLMFLPQLTRLLVPCLGSIPGQLQSYSYNRCNTVLVLDRFIGLALFGLAASVAVLYSRKKRSLPAVILTACIFATIAIAAYYQYIPQAEAAVLRAPIILESLK